MRDTFAEGCAVYGRVLNFLLCIAQKLNLKVPEISLCSKYF